MDSLLLRAAGHASRYLRELEGRRVGPSQADVAGLAGFDEPLPEGSTSAAEVLDQLDRVGSPAAMGSAGGRFYGFVIGGALPAALAANWLAAAWDQNAVLWATSPVSAALEQVSLRWLLDVLDLPRESGAAFVTGATVANFTALAAARHAVLEKAGWDVERAGLFGAPPISVVVSEEVHPSVTKSLGMLGLGRDRTYQVPVDNQGRMLPEKMPKIAGPAIVCVQAGNVNTGSFDPISVICAEAREAGAWVHVDGAFGLWAAASPPLKHLCEGVAEADSWATDAHKWLNVPYDSGLAFVRDAAALNRAMSLEAAYLPQGTRREPSQFTPELSRKARGVEIWAALRSLGRTGLADLVEKNSRQARRFAEGLSAAGFEILNEVVLNQVLVRFGRPDETRQTIGRIQEAGVCWAGETTWQGHVAMRISVSGWATTDEDVERSLESMIRAAQGGARKRIQA